MPCRNAHPRKELYSNMPQTPNTCRRNRSHILQCQLSECQTPIPIHSTQCKLHLQLHHHSPNPRNPNPSPLTKSQILWSKKLDQQLLLPFNPSRKEKPEYPRIPHQTNRIPTSQLRANRPPKIPKIAWVSQYAIKPTRH